MDTYNRDAAYAVGHVVRQNTHKRETQRACGVSKNLSRWEKRLIEVSSMGEMRFSQKRFAHSVG